MLIGQYSAAPGAQCCARRTGGSSGTTGDTTGATCQADSSTCTVHGRRRLLLRNLHFKHLL